jgi:hypothetical protein
MYWRGIDPGGHPDALYSLAALLVFVWALGIIGVYSIGVTPYLLLAAFSVLVAVEALRRLV